MDKMYSRKDAAHLLGISLTTLDAARTSGLIAYVQYSMWTTAVYISRKPGFRSILPNAHTVQNQERIMRPIASLVVLSVEKLTSLRV